MAVKKIQNDISDVMNIHDKRRILKDLHQEELIDLFVDYKNSYNPVKVNKAPVDQQVSFVINEEEKQLVGENLRETRKNGPNISISQFARNHVVRDVDIMLWAERAREGLKEVSSDKFDPQMLTKKKIDLLTKMDNDSNLSKEDKFAINRELNKLDEQLDRTKSKTKKRKYRLSGRVTYNETNIIRWRAARLTLSIADYCRFVMFDYLPFSEDDEHLSLDARKRFYVAILDVAENGWGEPPQVDECPNCRRYKEELAETKKQLERFKMIKN